MNRPIALKFDFLPFSRFGHSLFFFSFFVHKKVHFFSTSTYLCQRWQKWFKVLFAVWQAISAIYKFVSQSKELLFDDLQIIFQNEGKLHRRKHFPQFIFKMEENILFERSEKGHVQFEKRDFYVLGKYNSIHEQTQI